MADLRIALLALAGGLVTTAGAANVDMVPAFPGSEGFGAAASGGRGGRVVFVTSTDDDVKDPKPGTLRWACEKEQGPRYVIFRTGGIIQALKPIKVRNPNITIAAQTAPGAGICLQGSQIDIETQNVIVRGLRSRPGDGPGQKGDSRRAMDITCADTVIVDHCSLTWGTDELLDISDWLAPGKNGDCRNVTVQWCLLGEGLNNSIHGIDPGDTTADHSAPTLFWGASVRNISLHHNLLAHNGIRNPRFAGGLTADWINNVVYNWGSQPCNITNILDHGNRDEADLFINLIGNSWLPGPNTTATRSVVILAKNASARARVYLQDNVGPAGMDGDKVLNKPAMAQASPVFPPSVRAEPAEQAKARILAHVGATTPLRDAVDARIIRDVREGTGKIIDSPKQVGGYPDYPKGSAPIDSDNDGMPDEWEKTHGLDPTRSNANGHELDKNYDNLEIYINALVNQETAAR